MAPKSKLKTISAIELADQQKRRGHTPLPPPQWFNEELPPLLKKFGAFGFHIGMALRGGRWSKKPVLVFLTEKKGTPSKRNSNTKEIPKSLSWKDGRRRYTLLTDVIEASAQVDLHSRPILGPGDAADKGAEIASIGAAVRSPTKGDFLTTAGHLVGVQGQGSYVNINSNGTLAQGQVIESRFAGEIDYALIKVNSTIPCANFFQDQFRIGPVYTPTLRDVGAPLYVLSRGNLITQTICRGVNQMLVTTQGTYRNVIATSPVTSIGQSGGALIDSSNRLWGFLLGALPGKYSIFVPAQSIFDVAGVFLIH